MLCIVQKLILYHHLTKRAACAKIKREEVRKGTVAWQWGSTVHFGARVVHDRDACGRYDG